MKRLQNSLEKTGKRAGEEKSSKRGKNGLLLANDNAITGLKSLDPAKLLSEIREPVGPSETTGALKVSKEKAGRMKFEDVLQELDRINSLLNVERVTKHVPLPLLPLPQHVVLRKIKSMPVSRGIMQSKKENRNNNETKDACYSKEETDETDTIFKSKECEERRNIIRPHKNDSSFGCIICKRTFCDARSKKRHNMTAHCE